MNTNKNYSDFNQVFTFYVVPECEHWCHLVLLPVYAIQTLSYEIHFADFGGLPWLLSAFPWRRQTVGGEVWPPHLWSAEAPSTHCVSEYMSQLWPKWIKKNPGKILVNIYKYFILMPFSDITTTYLFLLWIKIECWTLWNIETATEHLTSMSFLPLLLLLSV